MNQKVLIIGREMHRAILEGRITGREFTAAWFDEFGPSIMVDAGSTDAGRRLAMDEPPPRYTGPDKIQLPPPVQLVENRQRRRARRKEEAKSR